jgi:hypothetical protein
MKLLIFVIIMLNHSVYASDLSKEHLLSVLDEMKKEGIVPRDKAPEVEEKIKSLSPEQFDQLRVIAGQVAVENPLLNQKTEPTLESAAQHVDTNSPEFKKATEQLKQVIQP